MTAPTASSGPPLAPPPPLDRSAWRETTISTAALGPLLALRPKEPAPADAIATAPALVCLPGLGIGPASFVRQLPLGRVAQLHALAHAREPRPAEPGLGPFALAVEEYIRAVGLERGPGGVVLLGTSMGGAVALTVALRGRVPLRGLVLIGTYASRRHLNGFQRGAAPLAWLLPTALARCVPATFIRLRRVFGHFTQEEARFIKACLDVPSRRQFGLACQRVTQLEIQDALREVRVPALVLHARDDGVLPYRAGEELARALPRAELVLFDRAGHALFLTHHAGVNAAAAAFLERLPGGAAP